MKHRAEYEICGRYEYLEEHHLIPGIANRKLSDRYKLKINICRACHNNIHNKKELLDWSKKRGQKLFERKHSREEFIKVFGRSYL
ncbi:hypothetical protein ACQRC6_01190 [Peptoniphilus sp. SGI.035]|uniref:hypothetical protein n=1 Tax=Peptoniphilus sp. SGI.035 TaxID=3420564 RepID=UPI003D029807